MKKAYLLGALFMGCLSMAQGQNYLNLQPGPNDGMDAQLRFQYPAQNAGSMTDFKAIKWTCGGNPCGSRGLLKFDLSQVPADAILDSVFLNLYHNPTASDPGHTTNGGNATWLRRVTQSWDENTVTLDTEPAFDTTGQYLIPAAVTGTENFRIPVKDMIQMMLDSVHGNHGWILMLENEQAYRSMIFASSDHADSTIRPRLEIYYHTSNVSVNELKTGNLSLFPNPSKGSVSLSWEAPLSELSTLKVMDLQGRVVLSKDLDKGINELDLDLETISTGTYIINIQNSSLILNERLILKN